MAFKTYDFMLASAQGFKAGESGENQKQHICQATLGPEAAVWVNHPACISENGNRRPNFWMGQATFPRVAQWKDTLIAVHRFRENDGFDFTHAYFPTWAFDDYVIQANAAFARKGDGYIALRAAQGLTLVTRGKSAYRELCSTGRQNVWLCQMGATNSDGDFAAFQKTVLALPARLEAQAAHFTSLRGEKLSFGWKTPLLVDGRDQPIAGFKHCDNPYCVAEWPAEKLEIRQGQEIPTLTVGDKPAR